ncbi:hypothetical protein B0H34DRAFT_722927, partial [Crassisporium funariophilum]
VVLPFELERKIFEIAVLLHPECVFKLVLVARYLQEWLALEALPYLRKLSFQPLYLFPDSDLPLPFDIPMFKNITHLHVITSKSSP